MEKGKPKYFYSNEVKRKRKTFKDHQKKAGKNPFENRNPKRKHNIVGVKSKKPIRPSRTTRRAVEKVTKDVIRNRNVLIDQKKRKKKRKRGNSNFRQRFNLNDTSTSTSFGNNRTENHGHLGDPDEEFLKRIGFNKGSGVDTQPPNKRRKLNNDPRTEKKKIYADVIRNSKIKRHKRKQNKIMLEVAVEELDHTFAEIRKMDKRSNSQSKIFSRNNQVDQSKADHTVPPPPPPRPSDDLSSLIESLQSKGTKLIRPSPKVDTMRTLEEQTRFLKKKEEERIERMNKKKKKKKNKSKNSHEEEDEEEKPSMMMMSGDALEDDYLHYVQDDEELDVEIEDLELDYDSMENRNKMKLTEGMFEDPVDETETDQNKKKKKRRKKKKKKTKGGVKNVDTYLPIIANSSSLFQDEDEDIQDDDEEEEEEKSEETTFIPDLPTTFKNLKDMIKNNRPSKIHTLMIRIETVHCARLSQGHYSKMSKFYTLLFRFFLQYVQKSTKSTILRDMKIIDVLSYHIHVLSFQVPRIASNLFMKKIQRMKNKYMMNSHPNWEDLFFLSLVKKVYPVSDFSHFIVTPLLRIFSNLISRVGGEKVGMPEYFLLVKIVLSILSSNSRYMPSLNNYFVHCFKKILAEKGAKESGGEGKDISDHEFIFGSEDQYNQFWRRKVFSLFSEYADICSNFPSFPEIFGPYEDMIKRIYSSQADTNLERSILDKIEKKKKIVWETRSFLTLSVPTRPPEIGMVSPSYQKFGRYRGKVIKDRVQKSALLRRKIKKAIRGVRKDAVKHIQKTESVGNLVKERERKRKERDMKTRYKRVITLLQQDRERTMTTHVKDKDIDRLRQRKKKIRERKRK